MKFGLYNKTVGALDDLKNAYEHGQLAKSYKACLNDKDEIFICRSDKENKLLEVKDDHTIVNCVKSVGDQHIWDTIIDIFSQGLEKRLGHEVKVYHKDVFNIYEKTIAVLEDLKNSGFERLIQDYRVELRSKDKVYVLANSSVLLLKLEPGKLTNHFKYRGVNPEWDIFVTAFTSNLEKKLGAVKFKDKGMLF